MLVDTKCNKFTKIMNETVLCIIYSRASLINVFQKGHIKGLSIQNWQERKLDVSAH